MLPLFPVPCMDALMPRAHGCAGAATQGYFLLLVQEKVAKEKDTPDGATFPATHPAPRESPGRTSLCARSPGRRSTGPSSVSGSPPASAVPGPGADLTRHSCLEDQARTSCPRPLRGACPEPYGARARHTGTQAKHTSRTCASVALGVQLAQGVT